MHCSNKEEMMTRYQITVNGKPFIVEVGDVSTFPIQVTVNGEAKTVTIEEVAAGALASAPASAPAPAPAPTPAPEPAPAPEPEPEPEIDVVPPEAVEGETVVAPMPGKVLSVRVAVGDSVIAGQTVCTLEAMKMEMPISATTDGEIQAIHVQPGQNVANDAALVTIG
jgi:glutaconyl-CoA/methylmalonyl-CoA decarboxylase subunit gamma